MLSYTKLRSVIDIFNACPSRIKGDSNNSDAFKESLEFDFDIHCKDHITKSEKLVRYVHLKLEEKFKNYRNAFRSFDKNYDGNLNFKEFMSGLENIGIRLSLQDFKKIFDYIDHD